MKVAIGSDHAGFDLKSQLVEYLKEKNIEVVDCGPENNNNKVDYPDYGHAVGKKVAKKEADYGAVICGSGIGISIAANKIRDIRCALCSEPLSAELSRRHNDANVVAMGARLIGLEMAKKIIDVFLNTEFEGGRHINRIKKIEEDI